MTGEAVPGAQITAGENGGPDGANALAGPDGTYRILGLEAGQYTVCFDGQFSPTSASPNAYLVTCFGASPGHNQPTTPVTVTSGQRTTVTGRLRPAGGITGQLTGPDGSPAAGVAVQVVGIGKTQRLRICADRR